jgi:hypothetical protein
VPGAPPPRLFIIPAQAADVAVVFRRGPAAWFHVLRWDLVRDEITPGAWLRGRLYPAKCDLSPDGSLLLYFAHQGRKIGSLYTDVWTALSRPPWLAALTLWPHGTTYGGGGRFTSNRALTLRNGGALNAHPDHPAVGVEVSFGAAPLHESAGLVPGAEWSGSDRRGNVLFALAGCLYRRTSKGEDRLVADLTALKPKPLPAPEWATEPLAPSASKRRNASRKIL